MILKIDIMNGFILVTLYGWRTLAESTSFLLNLFFETTCNLHRVHRNSKRIDNPEYKVWSYSESAEN